MFQVEREARESTWVPPGRLGHKTNFHRTRARATFPSTHLVNIGLFLFYATFVASRSTILCATRQLSTRSDVDKSLDGIITK